MEISMYRVWLRHIRKIALKFPCIGYGSDTSEKLPGNLHVSGMAQTHQKNCMEISMYRVWLRHIRKIAWKFPCIGYGSDTSEKLHGYFHVPYSYT